MKYIQPIEDFLNESGMFDYPYNILYNPEYHHIFDRRINLNHPRIKIGFIPEFYLKEYLKYYTLEDLKNVQSWEMFTETVHSIYQSKITNPNQKLVFRRGGYEKIMFFSDSLYVASVYSGSLNSYLIDLKNPYIINCENYYYSEIPEPEIMKGKTYDGTTDTDTIAKFISELGVYDGVIFLNLVEGSGADTFGESNVYVAFDKNNFINLSNN